MIAVDIDLIGVPAFVVNVERQTGLLRFAGVNANFVGVTGILAETLVGRTAGECMPPDVADRVERHYRRCIELRSIEEYDEFFEMPQGRRWWRTALTPEIDPETDEVTRILGVAVEITERKRLEHELKEVAFTDHLTGLANRRRFSDLIEAAMVSAANGGTTFSLVVIDLDDFKDVNDLHGHVAGDAVLQEVAARIRTALPKAGIIARQGGDEFVALVLETTEEELAATTYRLSDVLCRPFFFNAALIDVRASVGGAVWHPGITADGLMSYADARMYAAKARGRRVPSSLEHQRSDGQHARRQETIRFRQERGDDRHRRAELPRQ